MSFKTLCKVGSIFDKKNATYVCTKIVNKQCVKNFTLCIVFSRKPFRHMNIANMHYDEVYNEEEPLHLQIGNFIVYTSETAPWKSVNEIAALSLLALLHEMSP